jgi:hypothetical protein
MRNLCQVLDVKGQPWEQTAIGAEGAMRMYYGEQTLLVYSLKTLAR